MGLKALVSQIYLDKLTVAYRAPQLYTVVGSPYNIFTITGGPVWIAALFAHAREAVTTATTFTLTVGGVPIDVGPTVITSAIDTLILCALDSAAIDTILPNMAAVNPPTIEILLAGPGNIQLAVAAADTDGLIDWYCVYYKMRGASLIA